MSSRTYFDRVAPDWDRMRSSFFSPDVREKAYSVARVRKKQAAADIGAGTGFIAEGLLERGVSVIAVDQSEGMLAELRKRFPGIDARRGGEDDLPIPAGAVDHAFANMYLHHVENPAAAIREMARIVKPGGKVVITELDEHAFEFLRTEQFDRWMGFKRDQARQWFVEAGLQNVVVDCAGSNCCADSSSSGEHASVSIFVASGEKSESNQRSNAMSNVIAPDEIHQSVRDHYADLARQASSCCGPTSCECNTNYPDQLANAVPEDITSFSLGCGDPITIAHLQPGETVVDLGSGGGLDCFLAGQRVGPTGHVIGVDMTPEMLAKARANADRVGATNVEFREGYIEHLPVEDGTADVVISNCVINLSPDKPQVFRDIFRALRSGGRVAVSDIVTDGELPVSMRASMEAWGACVAGALDVKDYMGGLQAAGFADVRVTPRAQLEDPLALTPVHEPFSAIITARKP